MMEEADQKKPTNRHHANERAPARDIHKPLATLRITALQGDLQGTELLRRYVQFILTTVTQTRGVKFNVEETDVSPTEFTAHLYSGPGKKKTLISVLKEIENFSCESVKVVVELCSQQQKLKLKDECLKVMRKWKDSMLTEEFSAMEGILLSKLTLKGEQDLLEGKLKDCLPREAVVFLKKKLEIEGQQTKINSELKHKRMETEVFSRVCDTFSEKVTALEDDAPKLKSDLSSLQQKFGFEIASYKQHLPIYAYRTAVVDAVCRNDVVVLVAETGSGKSTQVVKYLMDDDDPGLVVCTQPRKIAASGLTDYVSQSVGSKSGEIIGYQFGTNKRMKEGKTKVVFTTDHSLLQEWAKDPTLSNYKCVIVDEAHERSLATDLLISVLRKTLSNPSQRRKPLRVVITSATIDPKLFLEYFSSFNVELLEVPGKVYPIETIYDSVPLNVGHDYVSRAVDKAEEVLCNRHGRTDCQTGNVLVFLATPAETDKAQKMLLSRLKGDNVEVLQLHGKLPLEEQKKIFSPLPKGKIRRVVFATNAAETSVTVPGITVVIDSGIVKERQFDAKKSISILKLAPINKSSARQRMGRAGRTAPGVCYRLYTKEDHNGFDHEMVPEIKRLPLDQCLLQLFQLGFTDPSEFHFIETPSKDALHQSLNSLLYLGAIEATGESNCYQLTGIGKKMSAFTMDPRLSKLVVLSLEKHPEISSDAIAIAAMASNGGNIFYRQGTEEQKETADIMKLNFCDDRSDFVTMLNVYAQWLDQETEKEKSSWCSKNYVNGKSMKTIRSTVKEIRQTIQLVLKLEIPVTSVNDHSTLMSLISLCFGWNLAIYCGHPQQGYLSLRNLDQLSIHPSSSVVSLTADFPKLLVYDQVLTTSRAFMLHISRVEITGDMEDTVRITEQSEDVQNQIVVTKRIGPIGGLILRRNLIGKGFSCLKSLEGTMKSLIEDDNSLATKFVKLSANFEYAYIELACHKRYEELLCELLLTELVGFQKQIADEEMVAAMRAKQCSLVMQQGGTVIEPLLAYDFKEICIHQPYTPQVVEEFFKSKMSCKDVIFLDDGKCIVSFRKPSQAMKVYHTVTSDEAALERLNLKKSQVVKKSKREVTERRPNMTIKLEFHRRKRTNFGFVVFNDEIEAANFVGSHYDFMGTRPKVARNKPESVRLVPLGLDVTQEDIKCKIAPEFKVVNVILPFDKAFETSAEDVSYMKTNLSQTMAINSSISSQLFDIRIFDCRNTHTHWKMFVDFSNIEIGCTVYERLKYGRGSLTVSDSTKSYELMSLEYSINATIITHTDVYERMKQDVDSICDGNIKMNCKSNRGRTTLYLESEDMKILSQSKLQLQDLLEGEKIEHPNMRFFGSKTNWEKLCTLQGICDVVIRKGASLTKAAVVIYGKEGNISNAKIHMNRMLGDIIDENNGFCSIPLNGHGAKRGILKCIVQTYGSDLAKLTERDGVAEAKITIKGQQKLDIAGRKEIVEQIRQEVQQLIDDVSGSADDELDCTTCLTRPDPDDAHRLEVCGHVTCKGCLNMQMKAHIFPVVCPKENCGSLVCIKDLKMAFGNEEELQATFLAASLESFISQNEDDFSYCPTPDCGSVFRKYKQEDFSSAGNEQSRLLIHCLDCRTDICTRCCVPNHAGYTCESHQMLRENGGSIRVWLFEDPVNRKLCPGCKTGIEKNGGCLKMQCIKCKTIMCWNCMVIYPTDDAVYAHMCPKQR